MTESDHIALTSIVGVVVGVLMVWWLVVVSAAAVVVVVVAASEILRARVSGLAIKSVSSDKVAAAIALKGRPLAVKNLRASARLADVMGSDGVVSIVFWFSCLCGIGASRVERRSRCKACQPSRLPKVRAVAG